LSSQIDVSPLFTPLTINSTTIPNRFVMPGMQRGWGDEGQVSDKTIEYYCERVRGGTGLITTEGVIIDHPAADLGVGELQITSETRDGWARCAEAVKAEGGHFLMQLWHPGAVRMEGQGKDPEVAPISPSGIFAGSPRGRSITEQDLDDLAAAWVAGATTAKEIGFDGVELHMAHGYLLHQFLWHEMNQRDDGHGGDSMSDRVRFPARVLREVREAVGPDFVISCRISQWAEWNYDAKIARTPEELGLLIGTLEAEGADMFHMSTRYFHNPEWPQHDARSLAGWVKSVTTKPVVTVGSVGLNVDLMQTLYSDKDEQQTLATSLKELVPRFVRGEFDLVAVGRSIIGDPEFVNKVRDGRFDEIRAFSRADLFDVLGGLDGHDVPEEILKLAQATADAS
jgi:2,4-dienoyl-CoA reductase-like NADH-dependent reductase (Old Yellow Enzyme family)